jgi:hypothetical protein
MEREIWKQRALGLAEALHFTAAATSRGTWYLAPISSLGCRVRRISASKAMHATTAPESVACLSFCFMASRTPKQAGGSVLKHEREKPSRKPLVSRSLAVRNIGTLYMVVYMLVAKSSM